MADDNLQDHLNKSIYGAPQTLPEERHRYLGSLRERIVLRLTNQQVPDDRALVAMKTAIARHRADTHYRVLINGKLDPTQTAPFMAAAQEQQLQFTLVNDETAKTRPTDTGVLLVSDEAINVSQIDYVPVSAEKDATTETAKDTKKEQPKGFLGRLFDR